MEWVASARIIHMNRYFIVILLIAIASVSAFLIFTDREVANYPPKDGPIVAFGDSLVAGTGSTEGNDFVSALSRQIGQEIINLGVPGDTTASGLSRIDEALKENPSITIVVLGGNDFLRKTPRQETFSNLRQIIDKLQAQGSIVVLAGVRGGLLSDNADGYYEALAEDTGSVYVPDILDGLFGDARYMSDSIHPNDEGYRKIAERLFAALNEYTR